MNRLPYADEVDEADAADAATGVRTERCPGCGSLWHRHLYRKCPTCDGRRNRERVERTAEVIRELKESLTRDLDPERERQLVLDLHRLDHPDVDGFLKWLAAERERVEKRSRGRSR